MPKKMTLSVLSVLMLSFQLWSQEVENIIQNSEFDSGTTAWTIRGYNEASINFEVKDDSVLSGSNYLEIDITNGGGLVSDVQVYQSTLVLQKGFIYDVSFVAKSSALQNITAEIQVPRVNRGIWTKDITLADTAAIYGPYTLRYRSSDAVYGFYLMLGGVDNSTVQLDAIVITKRDDPDHLRDVEKYEKRMHIFNGTTLPYRFLKPDHYAPENKYPLVLALHGAGERGTDNESQLSGRMAFAWSDSANQAKWPCFAVLPQCPEGQRWADSPANLRNTPLSNEMATVMDLLDSLIVEFSVDTNRLYITGISMGGNGTWDAIYRFPDKFAAAVPMSAWPDTSVVSRFMKTPMWFFHGEDDLVIPAEGSRNLATALEKRGIEVIYTHCKNGDCTGLADSEVAQAIERGARYLYTEWRSRGHDIWNQSYNYPYLLPWLFAQSKDNVLAVKEKEVQAISDFELRQNYPNPFNPTTVIKYYIPLASHVELKIYNQLGQVIRILENSRQSIGMHQVEWNGKDDKGNSVAGGVYFYRFKAGAVVEIRKMIMLK